MGKTSCRVTVRNPVVKTAAILRKGGAHGKSRKAMRRNDKVKLKRETRHESWPPVFHLAV